MKGKFNEMKDGDKEDYEDLPQENGCIQPGNKDRGTHERGQDSL